MPPDFLLLREVCDFKRWAPTFTWYELEMFCGDSLREFYLESKADINVLQASLAPHRAPGSEQLLDNLLEPTVEWIRQNTSASGYFLVGIDEYETDTYDLLRCKLATVANCMHAPDPKTKDSSQRVAVDLVKQLHKNRSLLNLVKLLRERLLPLYRLYNPAVQRLQMDYNDCYTKLGSIPRQYSSDVFDAEFISNQVLHSSDQSIKVKEHDNNPGSVVQVEEEYGVY